MPVGQAIHLSVLPFTGLADMVVDDQDLFFEKPALKKKILLAGAKIGKDFE
jgi:hypothetical protein